MDRRTARGRERAATRHRGTEFVAAQPCWLRVTASVVRFGPERDRRRRPCFCSRAGSLRHDASQPRAARGIPAHPLHGDLSARRPAWLAVSGLLCSCWAAKGPGSGATPSCTLFWASCLRHDLRARAGDLPAVLGRRVAYLPSFTRTSLLLQAMLVARASRAISPERPPCGNGRASETCSVLFAALTARGPCAAARARYF